MVISPSETELAEPPYPESTLLAATEGVLDRTWWRGAYWDAMMSNSGVELSCCFISSVIFVSPTVVFYGLRSVGGVWG